MLSGNLWFTPTRIKNTISWIMDCTDLTDFSVYFAMKRHDSIPKAHSLKIILLITIWELDLQLPLQLVHITIDVVSSIPAHAEVYSTHHNVIKCVSDLRHVCGLPRVLRFPPPIKLTAMI